MLKIVTIVGARPQIIKSAAISRVIKNHFSEIVKEIIVHTGQHYDASMSAIFFEELQIPNPDYNLNVGSGTHGEQTAKMIIGIEEILIKEKPKYIVLYGDTNSTLAGAIAASKIEIPVVHIEAGLRSFNKKMPEEINRVLTDNVSTYLFSPTKTGIVNLQNEGFKINNSKPYNADNPGIFNVGDVMYDNTIHFAKIAAQKINILDRLNLIGNEYVLATIHRNNNTDDKNRLVEIFNGLISVSTTLKIVLPLHPRTLKQIDKFFDEKLKETIKDCNIIIIPPVSFLEITQLEENAKVIITDSGGVQKEAYFFSKPCIILRSETEWVEIINSGFGVLCDANSKSIKQAFDNFVDTTYLFDNIYGEGDAALKIMNILINDNFERKIK